MYISTRVEFIRFLFTRFLISFENGRMKLADVPFPTYRISGSELMEGLRDAEIVRRKETS